MEDRTRLKPQFTVCYSGRMSRPVPANITMGSSRDRPISRIFDRHGRRTYRVSFDIACLESRSRARPRPCSCSRRAADSVHTDRRSGDMFRPSYRLGLHFRLDAATQITRVEVENFADVQKRKWLSVVLSKEPIMSIAKKLGAHRNRLIAKFQNTVDGIGENRQHQFLLRFEIVGPSKNF